MGGVPADRIDDMVRNGVEDPVLRGQSVTPDVRQFCGACSSDDQAGSGNQLNENTPERFAPPGVICRTMGRVVRTRRVGARGGAGG